jgi:preprotein translocase subunit SecE
VVLGFVVVMMAIVYGLDFVFSWMASVVFGTPGELVGA